MVYSNSGVGVWRSWLARTAGGREVAGSSPVTPTKCYTDIVYVAKERR